LCHVAHADSSAGNFLLQNYKQALDTLVNLGQELQTFKALIGFTMVDFLHWHQEETTFLSIAKQNEPDGTTLKVSYVEALQKLFTLEYGV
jgi:hypothetical protein